MAEGRKREADFYQKKGNEGFNWLKESRAPPETSPRDRDLKKRPQALETYPALKSLVKTVAVISTVILVPVLLFWLWWHSSFISRELTPPSSSGYQYQYAPPLEVVGSTPPASREDTWASLSAPNERIKPQGEGSKIREIESQRGNNPIILEVLSGMTYLEGKNFYSGLFNSLDEGGEFSAREIHLSNAVDADNLTPARIRVKIPALKKGERVSLYSQEGRVIRNIKGLEGKLQAVDGLTLEATQDIPEEFFLEYELLSVLPKDRKAYIQAPMFQTSQLKKEFEVLETHPALKEIKESLDKVKNASPKEKIETVREIALKHFIYNKYFNGQVLEDGTYFGWLGDILERGESFRGECDRLSALTWLMFRYLGTEALFAEGYGSGGVSGLVFRYPGHAFVFLGDEANGWVEFDITKEKELRREEDYQGQFREKIEKPKEKTLTSEQKTWEDSDLERQTQSKKSFGEKIKEIRLKIQLRIFKFLKYKTGLRDLVINNPQHKLIESALNVLKSLGAKEDIRDIVVSLAKDNSHRELAEAALEALKSLGAKEQLHNIVSNAENYPLIRRLALYDLEDLEGFYYAGYPKKKPSALITLLIKIAKEERIIKTRETYQWDEELLELKALAIGGLNYNAEYNNDYEPLYSLLPFFRQAIKDATDKKDIDYIDYQEGEYLQEVVESLRILLAKDKPAKLDLSPELLLKGKFIVKEEDILPIPEEILHQGIPLFKKVVENIDEEVIKIGWRVDNIDFVLEHFLEGQSLSALKDLKDLGDKEAEKAIRELRSFYAKRLRDSKRFFWPKHKEQDEYKAYQAIVNKLDSLLKKEKITPQPKKSSSPLVEGEAVSSAAEGSRAQDAGLTTQDADGLCLTPDSLIYLADGTVKPLIELKPFTPTPKSLVWGFTNLRGSEGDMVLSLNEATGKLEPHRVNALLDMGVKPVYRIRTKSGKELKTTLNHPYLTKDGWRKLKDIKAGDEIACLPARQEVAGQNSHSLNLKNPYFSKIISLPLKSSGLVKIWSSLSKAKVMSSIYDGWMRILAIPKKSSGGNLEVLVKCLSWVKSMPLKVSLVNRVTSSSGIPLGTENILCPFSSSQAISSWGIFSSRTKRTLCLDGIKGNEFRAFDYFAGVVESGFYSLWGKLGVIAGDYLMAGYSAFKQIQDQIDRYTRSFKDRVSAAYSRLRNDVIFDFHFTPLKKKYTTISLGLSRLLFIPQAEAEEVLASSIFQDSNLLWDKIVSIEPLGPMQVYDIEVEGTHNFVAQGIVAHNTYVSPPTAEVASSAVDGQGFFITESSLPLPINILQRYDSKLEPVSKSVEVQNHILKIIRILVEEDIEADLGISTEGLPIMSNKGDQDSIPLNAMDISLFPQLKGGLYIHTHPGIKGDDINFSDLSFIKSLQVKKGIIIFGDMKFGFFALEFLPSEIDDDDRLANGKINLKRLHDRGAVRFWGLVDSQLSPLSKQLLQTNISLRFIKLSAEEYSYILKMATIYNSYEHMLSNLRHAIKEKESMIVSGNIKEDDLRITESLLVRSQEKFKEVEEAQEKTLGINIFTIRESALLAPSSVVDPSTSSAVEGLCLTPDSLIHLADGTTKLLIELESGEMVLSLNEATGKLEPHKVVALLDMGVKPVYRLRTKSGKELKTTLNHPYLVKVQGAWYKVQGAMCKVQGKPSTQHLSPSTSQCTKHLAPSTSKWLKLKDLKAGDEIAVAAHSESTNSVTAISRNNQAAQEVFFRNAQDKVIYQGEDFSDTQQMNSQANNPATRIDRITQDIGKIRISGDKDKRLPFYQFVNFFVRCGGVNISDILNLMTFGSKKLAYASGAISVNQKLHRRLGGLGDKFFLIGQNSGIQNTGLNIFVGNGRKFFFDGFSIHPVSHSLKNNVRRSARSFDTGLAMLDVWFNANVFIKQFFIKHFISLQKQIYHTVGLLSRQFIQTTLNHPYLVRGAGCWVLGAGCKVEGNPSTQHPAPSTSKWLKLKDLKAGDEIAVANLTVPSQILDSFFNAAKGDKEISCLLNQRGVSFEEFNEFFCRKIGSFKDRIEGARFNSFRTMQRDYASAVEASLMPHNDMRTALPFNKKSLLFKGPDNLFAGDTRELGHTETSTSLSSTSTSDSGIGNLSSLRDQRYSSIASLILEAASSIVSPCEAHPESAGTWTEYPPSNSGSMITLNRFNISHPPISKHTISFIASQEEKLTEGKPAPSDFLWDKIVSIESLGPQQVYDIEVEGTHNFVAQGIVAHNTYSKDSIKVSKYQSVRDKDDRGQKPEDRSQMRDERETFASSAVDGIPDKEGLVSSPAVGEDLNRREFLKKGAAAAAALALSSRLRYLEVFAEIGAEQEVFLLGHRHIHPLDVEEIAKILYDVDGIEAGKDSPESILYRKNLTALLRKQEEHIYSYKKDIAKIKELLSDAKKKVSAIGLELTEKELSDFESRGREIFSTLLEVMRLRGVENLQEQAESAFLLLYGPVEYLLVKREALLGKTKLVALDNEEAKENSRRYIQKFREIQLQLIEICKKNKITYQVFKRWMEFNEEFLEKNYIPKSAEIEGIIRPFNHPEAELKALEGIAQHLEFVMLTRRRDMHMAQRITAVGNNMLIIVGRNHIPGIKKILKDSPGLKIFDIQAKKEEGAEKELGQSSGSNEDSSFVSSPIEKPSPVGGIDLRVLPFTIQPAPIISSPHPAPSTQHLSPITQHSAPNLDSQWQEIEKMLDAEIIPSTERIREYLFISCQSQDFAARIEKTLKVLADVLRLQENYCRPAEPPLKELLILLESDKPPQEFQLALSKIVVLPKEPANLAQ